LTTTPNVTVTVAAGSNTGTGTHTIGHTNYQVIPIPLTLGQTFTTTDQTATSFTLTVSDIEFSFDRNFTCVMVVAGDLTPSGAPYGTLLVTRALSSITAGDTTFDVELTIFLLKAADFIDEKLKNYEATLPLVTVPSIIDTIAEFYAAGLYMQKNAESEKAHVYIEYAEKKLGEYVTSEYFSGTSASLPFAVGTFSLEDEE